MSNVLVTGGAGYVGSHICKALRKEGFTPVVLDDLSRGNRSLVRYGDLYEANIADSDFLLRLYEQAPFEDVIHCAAFAYVGESMSNPRMYYENNVVNSIKFLGTLADLNIKNIIFSSSCATYGIPNNEVITTDDDQKPINPYGETKLVFENAIKNYAAIYGFNFGILRYFNVAGSDPDLEVGEMHEPETHIVPLLIRAALDDTFWFTINGDDYATPDGTCVRDYVHVMDLARAHVLGLVALHNRGENLIYNIGNGRGFSVLEIIEAVERITRRKVKYKTGDRRRGDPPELVACVAEVQAGLSWTPEYSDLDTIIATAAAWYKKNEGISPNFNF